MISEVWMVENPDGERMFAGVTIYGQVLWHRPNTRDVQLAAAEQVGGTPVRFVRADTASEASQDSYELGVEKTLEKIAYLLSLDCEPTVDALCEAVHGKQKAWMMYSRRTALYGVQRYSGIDVPTDTTNSELAAESIRAHFAAQKAPRGDDELVGISEGVDAMPDPPAVYYQVDRALMHLRGTLGFHPDNKRIDHIARDVAKAWHARGAELDSLRSELKRARIACQQWHETALRNFALQQAPERKPDGWADGDAVTDDAFEVTKTRNADDDIPVYLGTPPPDPNGDRAEVEARCHDCQRPYGDEHGFPDLIIPLEIWEEISPTGDDGGLLCPSCICARLHRAGKHEVPAAFMSGALRSVDPVVMNTLRHVENLRRLQEDRGKS